MASSKRASESYPQRRVGREGDRPFSGEVRAEQSTSYMEQGYTDAHRMIQEYSPTPPKLQPLAVS